MNTRPGGDRPGINRPGQGRPGQNRPGAGIANRPNLPDFNNRPTMRPGNRPGQGGFANLDRPGVGRPGQGGAGTQKQFPDRPSTRPGQGGAGTKRPIADRFPDRPGKGGAGTDRFPNRPNPNQIADRAGDRFRPRPDGIANRPYPNRPNRRGDNIAGNDRNRIGDNIQNNVNYNHWEHNHQTIINNSPTINNVGYRPGAAWGGYGYGYRGDWGYGSRKFADNSWCYGPGWRPAYSGYHSGWYHGSCSNDWNWGSYAAGVATGAFTGWALGSRTYDWGYSSYSNPYYTPAVQTVFVQEQAASPTPVTVYNYSQPINTEVPPPAEDVAEPAVSTFDQARTKFQEGDYQQALSLTDQALAKMPNDATMHEFRALVLFALGRYDEAAAVLYSVLAVGPGWDWTTMAGLYANIDVYTQQLRTLENYRAQHPDQAAPAFLLAYHYLTQGHNDAAADMYANVVKLQPGDTLSEGLLSALRPSTAPTQATTQAPDPSTTPSPEVEPTIDPARITGSWKATADPKTTISLALQPDGKFTWDVLRDDKTHRIEGTYTLEGDQLSLAQAEAGAMVGTVVLEPNGGFSFRALGAPVEDKGLAFQKS
jgi:tetratricopeptide (TPR) repeat protein